MKIKYLIGIDPGQATGICLYNKITRKVEQVKTVSMIQAFEEIEKLHSDGFQDKCKFIIEDPNKIRPTFSRGDMSQAAMNKISQNVGANKRDAKLLIEKCLSLGFEVEQIKPKSIGKGKKRKWTHEEFVMYTGCTEHCSQHARDAAALVVGR